MNYADQCPCGARIRIETVTPDFQGWEGECEAGHRVYLTDLLSRPRILEDV